MITFLTPLEACFGVWGGGLGAGWKDFGPPPHPRIITIHTICLRKDAADLRVGEFLEWDAIKFFIFCYFRSDRGASSTQRGGGTNQVVLVVE